MCSNRWLAILLLCAAPALAVEGKFTNQPPSSGTAGVGSTTVAALPACAAGTAGEVYSVTDGSTATDCAAGGGAFVHLCYCDGTSWALPDSDLAATATTLAANGANCAAGQYPLGVDASGAVENCTAAAVGDVVGPASSTDHAIARFDLATGKLLQDSVLTVADTTGDITAPGALTIAAGGSANSITLQPTTTGDIIIPDVGAERPALMFSTVAGAPYIYRSGASLVVGENDGTFDAISISGPAFSSNAAASVSSFAGAQIYNGKSIAWSNSIDFNRALAADADGALAQRVTTTAQTYRLYGTYTDASNYERVALSCDGSADCTLATETAGTGADDMDLHLKQAGAGMVTLGDGGATNYVQVASDGHMTFAGTATYWDDVLVPGALLRDVGSAPADMAAWSGKSPLYAYHFEAATDEELYGSIQMPHSWAGTPIYFHAHWAPETVSDGDPANQQVRWCIDYTWAEYDTVFPAVTTATCGLGPSEEPVADKHYITAIGTLTPGTGADQGSSILYFRLYRDADHVDDDYEHEAILLSVDAHFEANRLGSNTATPD